MNVSQFVAKWRKSALKERAASQEHFIDLCRIFDHPTPGDDGEGDTFTFEREVAKANGRRGRADVWKRGFFAWEYKSKGKDLEAAHDQLRQYRESLLNPPLLVACDMAILDIRTNFNNKETRQYLVPLEDLGDTAHRRTVEHLFYEPKKLEPGQEVEAITAKAAGDLAEIARRMRERGLDPSQVAMFLDRVVFCLFAQDVRLLKDHVFTKVVRKTHADPRRISRAIHDLFKTMNTGGDFALEEIPHFNGDLFADVQLLELTSNEVDAIHKVARLNWGEVDASILGTLFERGMDPNKEAEIGTHYTNREDISAIVEPVIMSPLRREWGQVRGRVDDLMDKYELTASPTKMRAKSPNKDSVNLRKARTLISDFLQRLQDVTILDPACGSGNFLFVSLQKLKDLEKEVLVYASERNIDGFYPAVGPWQLRGIEKSPYAYDLARMTIWIGWLQWTKANGYQVNWEPILRVIDNLKNIDAIIDLRDPQNPKEPEWPDAEFIVGNPPFLGDKKMRRELGDFYVEALRNLYQDRIPGQSDLCCYWFEKARHGIESGKFSRVGLLATQSIRGGASREVLKRAKQTGDIFFALSDRPWVQEGINVHVSMIGFDDGTESRKELNGVRVASINPQLNSSSNIDQVKSLRENRGQGFIGVAQKAPFDIDQANALGLLSEPNVHGLPNSDVLLPISNAKDITQRPREVWNIDFGMDTSLEYASLYERPFQYIKERVYPLRIDHREPRQAKFWWLFARPCPDMRRALSGLPRYIATPRVSKFRLFVWISPPIVCDSAAVVFARSDDYFFGVLHSRVHEVWGLKLGTRLETRPRYTPTTCFETFPFPQPFAGLEAVIGEAARDLDAKRTNYLNPIEWTREETLEFPGSINGPWGHLVHDPDSRGIGTVRYVRHVPKDAECARKLAGCTLTTLYNKRPTWLDLAHRRLDEAVFAAYGWKPDLTDDEILSRLLALNLERANTEQVAAEEPPFVAMDASDPSEHVD